MRRAISIGTTMRRGVSTTTKSNVCKIALLKSFATFPEPITPKSSL